jgi:hypothetical protein
MTTYTVTNPRQGIVIRNLDLPDALHHILDGGYGWSFQREKKGGAPTGWWTVLIPYPMRPEVPTVVGAIPAEMRPLSGGRVFAADAEAAVRQIAANLTEQGRGWTFQTDAEYEADQQTAAAA